MAVLDGISAKPVDLLHMYEIYILVRCDGKTKQIMYILSRFPTACCIECILPALLLLGKQMIDELPCCTCFISSQLTLRMDLNWFLSPKEPEPA